MSIELKNVSYRYENAGSAHTGRLILDDINLTISENDFTAIIGATGSGKSTLIQHFNLLLKATSGEVFYDGKNIYDKDFDHKRLRSKVGLVFQYPEYQLFEADVFSDVCFGPKNLGLDQEEVLERARQSLAVVGIDESDYKRSPFELSGGQKRRVAIAGVLAMKPKYLILDEPAAGLDPKGRRDMLEMVRTLHKERGIGVVLVSHSMDDVANYADRIIVINKGKIKLDDTPVEVFKHRNELEEIGLTVPQVMIVADELRKRGWKLPEGLTRMDEVASEILKAKGIR